MANDRPTVAPPKLFDPRPYVSHGLIEPGNVDLYAQPEVLNPDGSKSTVDSIGVNLDGREYLLPTVTPDGRHFVNEARKRGVPESEIDRVVLDMAINEFNKTGRHLGAFDSPEASDAYAKNLHEEYAAGKYRTRSIAEHAEAFSPKGRR